MKKAILFVIAGMLLSNTADLYCRLEMERWVEMHGRRGMPITWDLRLADLIARPIDSLVEANEHWLGND